MKLSFTITALALAAIGAAQVQFSEMAINPRGADNGEEFFELSGTAGTSLNGLWVLSIEGDNSSQGVVDKAISLQGKTIGANGLFLIHDIGFLPSIDPETTTLEYDFNPDLENGTQTYMIVRNYTGYVPGIGDNNTPGQSDIDLDNDGTPTDQGTYNGSGIAGTPISGSWYGDVIDSVGWNEGDNALDKNYAGFYGGADFGETAFPEGINSGLAPDYFYRIDGVALAGEFDANHNLNPTAYRTLGGSFTSDYVGSLAWTPGRVNPSALPEPATLAGLSIAALGLIRRRSILRK